MSDTTYPPMPPVGSPTPAELIGLARGTEVDVYVDGVVRNSWIGQPDDQFDGEPKFGPDAPPNKLVPGYMVWLGGSMAFVKARNIVKVYQREATQSG